MKHKTEYYDATYAGRYLGCGRTTVARIAKENAIGIFVRNRLVAMTMKDVAKIGDLVQRGPGNPEWIAAGQKKARSAAR